MYFPHSQVNKRKNINITYNTSLPVIFGVKKYADALWDVCNRRNIKVNTSTNLIEIIPENKEAVFQNVTNPETKQTLKVCEICETQKYCHNIKISFYIIFHSTPCFTLPLRKDHQKF